MTSAISNLKLSVSSSLSNPSDLSSTADSLNQVYSYSLLNGTGANQANMEWSDTRTLAPSATENLDMYGSLTSKLGGTIGFNRIKGFIVHAHADNTNNVLIGGADADAFDSWLNIVDGTDSISLPPGGLFAMIAPDSNAFNVNADTHDLLKMTNSDNGTSVTYDIILIGCV